MFFRSENTQIVQPTKISHGPVSFTPDIAVNKNAKLRKTHDKIPLRSQSDDYENDEDETENEEDDVEDDETYDEEESRKPRQRKTRQAENGFGDSSFCSSAECIRVQCTIKRLSRDQEVSVTFPSIVWVKTIQKVGIPETSNWLNQ